jgi:hypothetical protein
MDVVIYQEYDENNIYGYYYDFSVPKIMFNFDKKYHLFITFNIKNIK